MSSPKKQALTAALLVVIGLALSVPVGAMMYAGGIQADETGTSGQLDFGMAALVLIGMALVVLGVVIALASGARALKRP